MNAPTYTPESPCRCGYDGTGAHRCHAGRDPRYPNGQCPNEAEPGRFVASRVGTYSLAGHQMKVSGDWYHYCGACWAEIGNVDNRNPAPRPKETE